MRLSLILLCFLPVLLCKDALDNTNDLLKAWLPWWPKTEHNILRMAANKITDGIENHQKKNEWEHQNLFNDDHQLPIDVPIHADDFNIEDEPTSPLDELLTSDQQESPTEDEKPINFVMNFEDLGDCPRDCSEELRDALNIVLKEMSHVERYQKICGQYKNAMSCIHEDIRCVDEDRGMFETMTSGLHYMCIEQELAFNSTIECIDRKSSIIQSECESTCGTHDLFTNLFMKSFMKSSVEKGIHEIMGIATGNNPNPLMMKSGEDWSHFLQEANTVTGPKDPFTELQNGLNNFKSVSTDICRVGDCVLDCIRTKFNKKCEMGAGTMLSEVFVRPIAVGQAKMTMLRPVLGMIMPENCAFMYNNAILQKHRIDEETDQKLKDLYREKMEEKQKIVNDGLKSLENEFNESPISRSMQEFDQPSSPLDSDVFDVFSMPVMDEDRSSTMTTTTSEMTTTEARTTSEPTTTVGTSPPPSTTTTTTTTTTSTTTTPPTTEIVTSTVDAEIDELLTSFVNETTSNELEASGLEASGEFSGDNVDEFSGSGDLEGSGDFSGSGIDEDVEEASGTVPLSIIN